MTQQLSHHGIGASHVAAILGIHPHRSRIQVWQEIRGEAPPFEGNRFTKWGMALEPVIRQDYCDQYNATLLVPDKSLFHKEREWARATPDGIAVHGDEWLHLVEIKCVDARSAHRWGAEGSDEVPPEYFCQVQWQHYVTGLPFTHVAALIGGNDLRIHQVDRDDELIADMVTEAERFWEVNIIGGAEPAPDATDAYRNYLVAKYPLVHESYVPATDLTDALAEALHTKRVEMTSLQRESDYIANQLLKICGDARGIETATGRITFAPRRGSPSWKVIAEKLAAQVPGVDLSAMAEAARGAPSRPITVPRAWSKE